MRRDTEMRRRFVIVVAALAFTVFGCSGCKGDADERTPIPAQATHVVTRGEFLRSIAPQYVNVGWEQVLLANEDTLRTRYEEVCARKGESYRNNPRRRGLFCNDRYHRPWGNTLLPGWELLIPVGEAPEKVKAVVHRSAGDSVAIVIDDTGSMSDDRRIVGLFFAAALREHGKKIAGVWLYADGEVRHYEPDGTVSFMTTGGVENTHMALREAAKADPDTIVLVTDEPGDDWEWPEHFWESIALPSVIATCLPEHGKYLCEDSLRKLVAEAGGEYVAYEP